MGESSSSDAVISRVACNYQLNLHAASHLIRTLSGCQQTSLIPLRLPTCRPAAPPTALPPFAAPPPYCNETISLPAFRSQTDVYPDEDDAAKTRETVGFHCSEVISPSLVDAGPGGIGADEGLFRSKMYSLLVSPSTTPVT
jgi:hypothetical protein